MSRTRALWSITATMALSLTLAACGTEESEPGASADPIATTTPAPTTDEDDMTSTGQPDDTSPTSVPVPPPASDLPIGDVPAQVLELPEVQAAIKAEAQRTGVDIDDVTVAGYAEVTWRDGSLGCPKPGMMYTQALVPGHQLVLEVNGEYASYHAGKNAFTYCAKPTSPAPAGSGGDS